MASLAQGPSMLRDLNQNIRKAPGQTLSATQRKEARAAKARAQQAINSVRGMIEHSTQNYEASKKARKLDAEAKKGAAKRQAQAAQPLDVNQQFKADTETNLSTVKETVQGMENSISQIIPSFDNTLGLPGLSTFSATLETVPLVGMLNSTVQYVATTIDQGGNIDEEWDLFDDMPGTPGSGQTTSLFSYKGSFFVTVGSSVWAKTPKNSGDPNLAQASNNWPELYNPGWDAMGSCIPAENTRGLVPYSEISSDNQALNSWLIMVNSDGSLSYSSQEVGANMQFNPLPSDDGSAPNLLKAAYWNGSIWGYDGNMNLYQIVPNTDGTGENLVNYTIKSQNTLSDPILDLTAVDTGLVASRSDGNLWKLVVNPPADENSGPTETWTQWISQGGLYRYPNWSVSGHQPHAGILHQPHSYLKKLMKYSKKWMKAPTQQQKDKIAKRASKFAIGHCQAIGQLLSENLGAADGKVTLMTNQIGQINDDIQAQLVAIGNQITDLQQTINDEEQEEKTLTSLLWGAVAAAVCGIGLIIAAFFFPPLAPILGFGGGVLLIGGIITDLDGLGTALLGDPSSITAAENDVKKISKYLNDYVAILGSQGINPPSQVLEKLPNNLHSMPFRDLEQYVQELEPHTDRQFAIKQEIVSLMVHTATERLEGDDVASYLSILKRAVSFNKHIHHPYLKLSVC
uniref:Alpha-amylase type A isozyme n=1 Tax=Talaromyces marneffei PM1 TaxID=1077442 RepID=A0A093VSI9_TALMA